MRMNHQTLDFTNSLKEQHGLLTHGLVLSRAFAWPTPSWVLTAVNVSYLSQIAWASRSEPTTPQPYVAHRSVPSRKRGWDHEVLCMDFSPFLRKM